MMLRSGRMLALGYLVIRPPTARCCVARQKHTLVSTLFPPIYEERSFNSQSEQAILKLRLKALEDELKVRSARSVVPCHCAARESAPRGELCLPTCTHALVPSL